jgi:DNA-binding CsgD family transcriptional regulator
MLQRDAELAALGHRLDDIRAGSGRVVVVEGPAGIGKSSLLTAAARTAQGAGVRTLRAWGGPLEREAAWGIARQLFAPVYGGPEWTALAVGAAGLARRALDPDEVDSALAGDAVHAAAHGLTWLAAGLAERGPALLVVDDVHWADAPSLRWLVRLAHQLPELRLGVLCAVRTGEPPSDALLLAELLAAAPDPPVVPRPLGPAAAGTIVAERIPAAGPAFARACHAASAGNPFLLHALLDHLVAEGSRPTDDVAARLRAFGPAQVARSVELQLSRLPPGATALARAFAVLGREAPLRLAGELAGLAPRAAGVVADHLHGAGLLTADGGRHALAHPLVASALYTGLPPGERASWHARAAELLARDGADAESAALHLLRTEPGRDAATVAVLREAADRASVRGAPESAAVLLRRALAEPPPDRAVEAEVRAELGLALAVHVQPGAVAMLEDAVRLAVTPAQRARIALAGARTVGLAGLAEEAVRLCRLGLEPASGVAPEVRTRLEVELTAGAWVQAATVAEARERLHRHGPPAGMWRIHAAWEAVYDARPADEPRRLLAAVLRDGPVTDDGAESLQDTLALLGLLACDEVDTAAERCGALVDVTRPQGRLAALAHASFLRAMASVRAGRIHDAAADARLAFDFKIRNSPPFAVQWGLLPLVDALVELDELDQAEAALEAARRVGDARPGALTIPFVLERQARVRLARRRPAEAHRDLAVAAGLWRDLGVCHPALAAWRVDDAEALVALGDVAGARRLAEEHLTLADRVGLPGPAGAGLRALARASEPRDAVVLLERAVDLLAGCPVRIEHARALVDLGAALRRANRRAEGQEVLRRGLDLADRLGMRRLARRALDELRATGARPRRTAHSGLDALTPAEHRVAVLAAEGLSNREIAQQLYVTRRTVETHLTHAFQKLGLAARADLGAVLTTASGPGRRGS